MISGHPPYDVPDKEHLGALTDLPLLPPRASGSRRRSRADKALCQSRTISVRIIVTAVFKLHCRTRSWLRRAPWELLSARVLLE